MRKKPEIILINLFYLNEGQLMEKCKMQSSSQYFQCLNKGSHPITSIGMVEIILNNNYLEKDPILESNQDKDYYEKESQRLQQEIDKINKEFQENSSYQEIKPEEVDAELGDDYQESDKENPIFLDIQNKPANLSNKTTLILSRPEK